MPCCPTIRLEQAAWDVSRDGDDVGVLGYTHVATLGEPWPSRRIAPGGVDYGLGSTIVKEGKSWRATWDGSGAHVVEIRDSEPLLPGRGLPNSLNIAWPCIRADVKFTPRERRGTRLPTVG